MTQLSQEQVFKNMGLVGISPYINKKMKNFYSSEDKISKKEAFKDPKFLIFVLKDDSTIFQYIPEEFKSNKEFLLESIKNNSSVFQYIPEELKNDRSFILESVKINGDVLYYTKENIKNDKEIVLEAVENNGQSIRFASEDLKNDKDIGFAAFNNDNMSKMYLGQDVKNILENKEKEEYKFNLVIENFIKTNHVLDENKEFKKEEVPNNFIKRMVKSTSLIYDFYSESNIVPTREEALKDPAFALHIVSKNGLYLADICEELKNNKEIVLEAVKNNGKSIQFASESLKNDKEIFYTAVKNDSNAIRYVSRELQEFAIDKGVENLINPDINLKIENLLDKVRSFFKSPENTNKNQIR